MNSRALWKERFRHFLKEVRTYSKYVFNDHLKFIFVFIIGAGAYYYQQWLQTLKFLTGAYCGAIDAHSVAFRVIRLETYPFECNQQRKKLGRGH